MPQDSSKAPGRKLRVLLVEDSEDDAELLIREIRRGGHDVRHERVQDAAAFDAALDAAQWDVIVCDWSLPRFSAPAALAAVTARGTDVPFIIVSGTIDEETAVEAMRVGAHDFLSKERLARLAPAIEREVRDAEARREQQRLREQVILSERLSSIGMLAAGVAHEINNPLAAIISTLDYVAEVCARAASVPATELEEPLADAREAADRMRDIVHDLRMFSHVRSENRGAVDVRRVIESSARMAYNEIRHRARLVKDLAPVPPSDGNDARLGQVFLNLLVNAAQAIPEGRADENEIRVASRVASDGRIAVDVRDTGVGIPAENLRRIFEPFFTTKSAGVGTGLGLAICRSIVTELGGELLVDSEPGRGTCFTVLLPVSKTLRRSDAPPPPSPEVTRSRVLLIDDEAMMGRVVARMLRDHHEIVATSSPRDAIDRIARGERFDAILCDVMMPELTGADVHEHIARIHPPSAGRMVFLTGGAFTPRAAQFLESVTNRRLEKPFDRAALLSVLADVLATG